MKNDAESAATLERGRKKRTFLYKQVAEKIHQEIKSGVYKPGDRIPSMDDLAAKFAINKITVSRALKLLASEGIVYSIAAKGTFVAEEGAPVRKVRPKSGLLTVGIASHVMVPGQTGYYHIDLQEAIRRQLCVHSGNLVVMPLNNSSKGEVTDMILQSGLDAVIYIGPFDPTHLRELVDQGPPAVLMDHVVLGLQADTICQDNAGGAFLAVQHLLELGHRDVAVITGTEDQVVNQERLEGVSEAWRCAGLPDSKLIVEHGDFTETSGRNKTAKLLTRKKRPSAIFYFNDEMALGGIHAIYEAGLRIPEDISIVGFDDIPLAGHSHINLTTIDSPVNEMGALAVQRLLARIKNPKKTCEITRLATSLVLRNSTAPV